jgi:hypothetical protein
MHRTVVLIPLLFLLGCGELFGEPSIDEVAWAKSPNGRIYAIVSETNGGATTSYGYLVELHPSDYQGEKPVSAGVLDGAARSECANAVNLRWVDDDTLAIRFYDTKRTDIPEAVTVGDRRIRIIAQSGVNDAAAPCGEMAASH